MASIITLEEIKKRGFKDASRYSLSYTYSRSYLYEYRLKKEGSSVVLEEKITDKDNDTNTWNRINRVLSSYSKVKEWSGIVPVGINNVPYKATMVMKMSDGTIYSFSHKMNFVRLEEGQIDIDALVDTAEGISKSVNQPSESTQVEPQVETPKVEEPQVETPKVVREEKKYKQEEKKSSNSDKSGKIIAAIGLIISVAMFVGFFLLCKSCMSSTSDWFNTRSEIHADAGERYKVSNKTLNFEGEMNVVEVTDNHVTIEFDSQQFIIGDKESGYGSFLIRLDSGSLDVLDVYDIRPYSAKVLLIYSGDATIKSGTLANNRNVQMNASRTDFLKIEK